MHSLGMTRTSTNTTLWETFKPAVPYVYNELPDIDEPNGGRTLTAELTLLPVGTFRAQYRIDAVDAREPSLVEICRQHLRTQLFAEAETHLP